MLKNNGKGQVDRMPEVFRLGLDLGSTTAKLVLVNSSVNVIYSDYHRHKADVLKTILSMLDRVHDRFGNIRVCPVLTGSAGMGIAERTDLPFVQEVVAASGAVTGRHPQSKMLIDIGGEDSKMIFFNDRCGPDMRMNGNCAGGTGAFIDQMASLMNLTTDELDQLALQADTCHTIASRCGVFAKTDVQNLINTGIPKTQIAASVFQAVAIQAVNSLARGRDIKPPVVFVGGPLFYYRSLRQSFCRVLSIHPDQTILPEMSRVFPAYGAALTLDAGVAKATELDLLCRKLKETGGEISLTAQHDMLFKNDQERIMWDINKAQYTVPRVQAPAGKELFVGIDAGSTTTKIVAADARDQILFVHYDHNRGNPVKSVQKGLFALKQTLDAQKIPCEVKQCVVTGYGEELIRAALNIDTGMVETLAHYYAARQFDPDVTFILDIGGQDIKAIFVENGLITKIEVNEACSSGCGSFIETFADSLGYTAAGFGDLACTSRHPADLGSRCTVFMNSSVKQALRQGSHVADVAAGLSYAVIQNCLHKVLRISDARELGGKIVAQGGTFKNPAVLRALEKLLDTDIVRPDIAEYMGAYGAAIYARQIAAGKPAHTGMARPLFDSLACAGNTVEKQVTCKGCTNHCRVHMIRFPNGCRYYTGNRCDQKFSNSHKVITPGDNLFNIKYRLLEDLTDTASDAKTPDAGAPVIGIPMVLNLFENFPFWAALFNGLGFTVVRSRPRDKDLGINSATTIMSDNICYPAKLVHAHIFDLITQKTDFIFFPRVVFEASQFKDESNHFNCPVITGYPDVINSAVNPSRYGIPMDSPTINFNDKILLEKACRAYVKKFNVPESRFQQAFSKALGAMDRFKQALRAAGKKTIERARANNELMVVLAGRPYHADPAVNHAIPDLISRMGIHVLSEDALPLGAVELPESLEVADQWQYSNRLYRAAHWTGKEPAAQFVQFNSFGCGPDAVVIDEVKVILKTYGKVPVVLKIDEITSIGSARLRIRSMLETRKESAKPVPSRSRKKLPPFKKADRARNILVPDFSPFYSLFAQTVFIPMGYQVEILPPPDNESVKLGLKYVNNDMCYPAIITIGDIIKGLNSGKYDLANTAVALTETGGQCRATNYTSLLKKALLQAGYDNIPVVSPSFSKQSANDQPGFSINRPQAISLILSALLVMDQLIRMYHAIAVRERTRGDALAVLETHVKTAQSHVGRWTVKHSSTLLEHAINDFNRIRTCPGRYPKAGIVGEIYVKYNPFANNHIVDRLTCEGIQVFVPPLMTFFMQSIVNISFNAAHHIQSCNRLGQKGLSFVQRLVDRRIRHVNTLMSSFKVDLGPIPSAFELARKAETVISLANQAGEGWLLPGEVVTMAESGIRNIISLQPFGCIANHIVAKGMSKKLTDLFPDLNFLALDMDAGNSDANIQNRLAFFIHTAKQAGQDHPAMSA